ncbi:hypothetical protein CAEBREN_12119 [Caenorhabditis brenneri]|uniref:Smr domain-containing protein n=1 Tax=Caenorhabditis brenneri TaxID=135651 RepID=G0NMX4_CAEBE|nr:hypothetical protein CAEBREN_12119 [Caenorhabditis brenneri]
MPRSKEFGYLRSFANKSGQRYVDLCYFTWKRENPYLNYDIEKLFSLRRRFDRKELIKKEIDNAINYLARKNNTEELSRIESPWTPHLEFNLHNFTCTGALDYVREVVQKMRKAEKRLVHGDETIVLITGKGYEQDENEGTIKNNLLEEYQGQIKVDKKNPGRLNLTLKQKMSYACCIPAYFFS